MLGRSTVRINSSTFFNQRKRVAKINKTGICLFNIKINKQQYFNLMSF